MNPVIHFRNTLPLSHVNQGLFLSTKIKLIEGEQQKEGEAKKWEGDSEKNTRTVKELLLHHSKSKSGGEKQDRG